MKGHSDDMKLNRRQAIARTLGAAAACALGSAPDRADAEPSEHPSLPAGAGKLTIGIATFGFADFSNAELAKELSAAGLHTIQLFLSQKDSPFWRYNSRSDLSSLTPERCQAIAETYRAAGIHIHSIGVYTNLIHPDAAERTANLAYFKAMMEIGRRMGVRVFVTEAGHYQDPRAAEPPVPLHFQDAVWPQALLTFRELARVANGFDATVLLEPFYRGFLASAKRTRMFLQEVNSPHIRALLDPANLIEVNDLDEMFQQLGPWIDCLHAKDRKLHTDAGVAAGAGELDYPRLVALTARNTPRAPLVLEYVGAHDYRKALAHLRAALQQAGVQEQR
jgi:sugar phosphate isomerase/epimerase